MGRKTRFFLALLSRRALYTPSTMKGLLFLCAVLVSANMINGCYIYSLQSCVQSSNDQIGYDPCGGGQAMLDCFPNYGCNPADFGLTGEVAAMEALLETYC